MIDDVNILYQKFFGHCPTRKNELLMKNVLVVSLVWESVTEIADFWLGSSGVLGNHAANICSYMCLVMLFHCQLAIIFIVSQGRGKLRCFELSDFERCSL